MEEWDGTGLDGGFMDRRVEQDVGLEQKVGLAGGGEYLGGA